MGCGKSFAKGPSIHINISRAETEEAAQRTDDSLENYALFSKAIEHYGNKRKFLFKIPEMAEMLE